MGAGKILGLALAGIILHDVVKKSGIGKEMKDLMKDIQKETQIKETNYK